jgi:hypothetical protein
MPCCEGKKDSNGRRLNFILNYFMEGAFTMRLTNKEREARNRYMREYMRKWREENKERVQIYQKRYWQKKAQGIKEGALQEA